MDNLRAYQQNSNLGITRIDLILLVYEGITSHLERARELLQRRDSSGAQLLLARVQIGVTALAAGNDPRVSDVGGNFARLYEFVLHRLTNATVESVGDALKIVSSLREGFQAIRDKAIELERGGAIPAIDRSHALQASA